jgi:hypothetical protein
MQTTPTTTKHGIRWDHAAQHDDNNQAVYQSSCWRYEITTYQSGDATLYDAFEDSFRFFPTVTEAVAQVEYEYDLFLNIAV